MMVFKVDGRRRGVEALDITESDVSGRWKEIMNSDHKGSNKGQSEVIAENV